MVLEDRFFAPSFCTRPSYFYSSVFVFTRQNDGWAGLYIKLWIHVYCVPILVFRAVYYIAIYNAWYIYISHVVSYTLIPGCVAG